MKPTHDPLFWRAGAVSATVIGAIVLAFLTVDSYKAIRAGGTHVPPYTVVNHQIGYQFNEKLGREAPVIGGEQLLFGRNLDETQARALMAHGKLVIQTRACIDCHTFFGNGAYYAPDLTKAWLDPVWKSTWMPMTGASTQEEAMVRFLMHPDRYPTWDRQMPNLHLTREDAESVVAYLKWMSAIDTNGFPAGFGRGAATVAGAK